MKKANVLVHGIIAGEFIEHSKNHYTFQYCDSYQGQPISLTLPVQKSEYSFDSFPAFFDGLLPEGIMLEGLLRKRKIDKYDYFSQLLAVGNDLIGAITVEEAAE